MLNKSYIYLCTALTLALASCKKPYNGNGETPEAKINPYISQVFAYNPAPGQFINSGVGNADAVKSIVGKADGLLSLGAYGGHVIFGFNQPVANQPGADIAIFSNPITGGTEAWSEPGIVCVMQDINGNGRPDDGEWYELAGNEYAKPNTIKQYKITYYKPESLQADIKWTDNQGNQGYVLRNQFHEQDYFPAGNSQISFEGTLLPNTLSRSGTVKNYPMGFGYADNGDADYNKLQATGEKPYNAFDLDWAVDKTGKRLVLAHIDFVKVYTAQNCNGNPANPNTNDRDARMLGEISTELSGAKNLHIP